MIAKRRTNPVSACPLTAAIAALGGKWKLIVLYWLAAGPLHFADIRQRIPGISNKVLAEQLAELLADDLIRRSSAAPPPAPVTYALTDHGQSALEPLNAIHAWGKKHAAHFETLDIDRSPSGIKFARG